MLILMRAGILGGRVVVVAIGVMVVVVGMMPFSEEKVFVSDGGGVCRGRLWADGK